MNTDTFDAVLFLFSRREFSARKQDISHFQTNRVCNCRERNFCRRSIFFINVKMAGLKSKQSVLPQTNL